MSKLDTTTGLSAKQIGVIKYKLKNAIGQLLPLLPDSIEMKVFFEGRSAWIYSWRLLDKGPIDLGHPISVEVLVKLKKEFMKFHQCAHFGFVGTIQLQPDVYQPKVSVRKIKPARLE